MRDSITTKLALAMSGLTVAVLAATLALAWWSFRFGFLNYINAQEAERLAVVAADLASLYAREGSWQAFDERRLHRLIFRHQPPHTRRPPPRGRPPPGGPEPPDAMGPTRPTWMEDVSGNLLAGRRIEGESVAVPVVLDNKRIATLRTPLRKALADPLQSQFATQQLQTMGVIAVLALVLALMIAYFLSRALVAPIKRTISGVNQLASGHYDTRFAEQRRDELGDLAANLDRLAVGLEQAQSARRRWLADISHELRTPLSVLRAELDAIEDGVRPLDARQLTSFDQEVQRLSRLIDDLYDLALSDMGGLRYEFEAVDVVALICELKDDCERRHPSLDFVLKTPQQCLVRGDEKRLAQLFVNLLANACAYTDVPGRIEIAVRVDGPRVWVEFEDSAPGLNRAELEQLFDPLYRADTARDRRRGGAGLGLAICANIVRAHGGEMRAHGSSLGGVRISLWLDKA